MPGSQNVIVKLEHTADLKEEFPPYIQPHIIAGATVSYRFTEDHLLISQSFFDEPIDCCIVEVVTGQRAEMQLRAFESTVFQLAMLKGSVGFRSNDFQNLELKAGEFCFLQYNSGIHHVTLNGQGAALLIMRVHPSLKRTLFSAHFNWQCTPIWPLGPEQYKRWEELKLNVLLGGIWEVKRRMIFLDFLLCCWTMLGLPQGEKNDLVVETGCKDMARVKAYIKENFDQRLTEMEIATHFKLSVSQLRRRYMSAHGLSPSAYLREVRRNHAGNLICNSKMSLQDVAWASGYDSIMGLSRMLHKSR
ncbi:AraC family transcriptional regulator [Chitinophaga pollutisoli]|uniref:AraC family transcriptional regulator n=1 Tax=Chitinophaga pollutisoli TaxID=3133966 RepID=A0ABZ2YRB2_9BACT